MRKRREREGGGERGLVEGGRETVNVKVKVKVEKRLGAAG